MTKSAEHTPLMHVQDLLALAKADQHDAFDALMETILSNTETSLDFTALVPDLLTSLESSLLLERSLRTAARTTYTTPEGQTLHATLVALPFSGPVAPFLQAFSTPESYAQISALWKKNKLVRQSATIHLLPGYYPPHGALTMGPHVLRAALLEAAAEACKDRAKSTPQPTSMRPFATEKEDLPENSILIGCMFALILVSQDTPDTADAWRFVLDQKTAQEAPDSLAHDIHLIGQVNFQTWIDFHPQDTTGLFMPKWPDEVFISCLELTALNHFQNAYPNMEVSISSAIAVMEN